MTGPAVALGAYLLGSLPVLYLIGRLRGYDLRGKDQHITLWRRVGRAEGSLGVAWDIGKGALVVVVARELGLPASWVALAGLAVVIGQMWPFLLWDLGEKGNSTGLGMALALSPQATALALVPALIGAAWRTLPRLWRASSWNERLRLGGPPSRSLPLGVLCTFAILPMVSAGLGNNRAT
ncbi:MAG: glycerol-3-phosphate acyltransferase, partial [Chloroflexota bacterium]